MTSPRRTNPTEITRDSLQPRVVWLEKDLEQLVTRFLRRKIDEYEALKRELEELQREAGAQASTRDTAGGGKPMDS